MRHYSILNAHLATRKYMVADTYTIIDMDVWGWARMIPLVLDKEAFGKLPHLKRLVDEVEAKPAAQTALGLKDKFTWKTDLDDEARRNMFRHLAVKA
jgi:GSH-dependent disulfide-bond oxidoreductase